MCRCECDVPYMYSSPESARACTCKPIACTLLSIPIYMSAGSRDSSRNYPIPFKEMLVCCVNVNTTDAKTGATALYVV